MREGALVEVLREHVERMWQAEQAVASRYSDRTRLLTTQCVAVLVAITVAFSTIIIDTRGDDRTDALVVSLSAVTALYIISATFLIIALSRLLHSSQYPMRAAREFLDKAKAGAASESQPIPPTASWELALPPEYLSWLEDEMDPAVQTVLLQVLHAVENLQTRNLKERYRIRSGESAMMWGFWFALGFLLAFGLLFAIILWF